MVGALALFGFLGCFRCSNGRIGCPKFRICACDRFTTFCSLGLFCHIYSSVNSSCTLTIGPFPSSSHVDCFFIAFPPPNFSVPLLSSQWASSSCRNSSNSSGFESSRNWVGLELLVAELSSIHGLAVGGELVDHSIHLDSRFVKFLHLILRPELLLEFS